MKQHPLLFCLLPSAAAALFLLLFLQAETAEKRQINLYPVPAAAAAVAAALVAALAGPAAVPVSPPVAAAPAAVAAAAPAAAAVEKQQLLLGVSPRVREGPLAALRLPAAQQ